MLYLQPPNESSKIGLPGAHFGFIKSIDYQGRRTVNHSIEVAGKVPCAQCLGERAFEGRVPNLERREIEDGSFEVEAQEGCCRAFSNGCGSGDNHHAWSEWIAAVDHANVRHYILRISGSGLGNPVIRGMDPDPIRLSVDQ
ncbi:hypothetical protein ACFQZC_14865 [Streptacidiphilus monticola]